MQTDVAIIGAGPTGLALACQLIRYGIDFIILDEKEGTTPYSRAIGVQARTLEIYEQLGFADELVSKGLKADGVRLLGGGKIRGGIDLSNLGKGLSPFPFLLIVDQGIHEAILFDFIKANQKDVLWNTKMTSFAQDTEGVSIAVTGPEGSSSIRARYLVGCDGAHSSVRHGLGIEFGGSTFERLFYVADVTIDWEFSHDALHINLGDNTMTAFFPMAGDKRWRIVGTFPEGHDREESEILYEEIEQQIRIDTDLAFDITNVNWFSVYKVHSRSVSRFSDWRCFLAGDAAHIHTPVGAQGMNTGIQDGYNLAWKLAQSLKYGAGEALLDTYNEERLPNARRLLATTDRFFNFAASDEWFTSFVRKHIFPYVAGFVSSLDVAKRLVFPIVSQIGIGYEESSLSVSIGEMDVKAGSRMPWFEIGGQSIYDDLSSPKFHLIVFSDGETEIPPIADSLTREWQDRIDSHFFPLDERVKEAFGCGHSFFVVLRPDNYIGLISDDFAPESVTAYLRRFG